MQVKLLDDNTIGVFFTYNHRLVALVRAIPGARYEPSARFWYFALDGIAAQSVKTLAERGFSVEGRVYDRLEQFTKPTAQNFAPKIPETLPLYPFQRETAEFMLRTGSCLNANFVGSGKTLTSLAVCEALRANKVLIVAPKSVVQQWGTIEIPKWLPDKKVSVIFGDKHDRQVQLAGAIDSQYVVASYETVRIQLEEFMKIKWGVIILDEIHRIANTRTQTYKALVKLNAIHRFGLSATPVMNKPDDLFGVINFLRPGILGSWYQFMKRYIVKDYFGSPKYYINLEELGERVKPFIIKKSLAEVGMELPPFTEEILPVILSTKERETYDLIKKELLFDIEKAIISKIDNPVMLQNTVVKLGKLFELCDHMSLLGESEESSKLEVLKEHLEERLANGEKAIIITRFSRMAEILVQSLQAYKPLVITGATMGRQAIIQNFEQRNERKLLIGTEAIGQGLNLQMANVLYNYDSAWNPARMEQRAGRIYRDGQTKPVFIYNLVVQRSVEQWLQKKLSAKQEMSDKLLPKSFVELKEILTKG